jgi:stage II sporulation protein AB (anti-sigma F factor)
MAIKNQITMSIQSLSENVGIARVSAAAFAAQVDFTLNEIEEIKVAISEAVSNAVIHGYEYKVGKIEISMVLYEDKLEYIIADDGKGIADISLARQPAYSSDPERMGLGFAFMESFMDELHIKSEVNKGTQVRMVKKTLLKTEH